MSQTSRALTIQHLSFKYPEAVEALFTDIGLAFYTGWTGVVGANGCGKSTLLHLINHSLKPDSGDINSPGDVQSVEQRTDQPPPGLVRLSRAEDAQIWSWRAKLGIQPDWFNRWGTISHGERKRLQIAQALSHEPDVLILDEPDNHLDINTKEILLNTLKAFQGIGLIISHDRHLLDALCDHTLFLDEGQPDMRTGGYSAARQELDREQLEHQRQKSVLQKEARKLRRELQRRSEEVSRTAGRRNRGHLARGDSDGRAKIGLAIYSGKDKKIGRLKQTLSDRVDKVEARRSAISIKKAHGSGIHLGGGAGHRAVLIDESAGSISPNDSLAVSWPDLVLERGQCIAITGANGSGKSILLNHLIRRSKLPKSEVLYMPQEIPLSEGSRLLENLHQLSHDEMGQVLTIVRRLGSDPEGLLHGDMISPGESRKLMLALGMSKECSLLVLDEPTNHLDLLAITCLEEALLEWEGGILLVSHDRHLVSKLARTIWTLESEQSGNSRLSIKSLISE
ncbi:MAG: ABC-F family ATP-binding cassette domain-containing protein [Candidatus Marinimicrobia bacterium]|nr:ABC-F family ATP-binding cassette domain-containing protein [Candidatus Neomarinimicrobiota bacterium]